jgi:hypothetical protein
VVLVVVGALVALAGWLFVWPPDDPPGRVDAVLVLAGGTASARPPGSG